MQNYFKKLRSNYTLCKHKTIQLDTEMNLLIKHFELSSDYVENFEVCKKMVSIYFCLSGFEKAFFTDPKKEVVLKKGRCGIFLSQPEFKGKSAIMGNNPFRIISINLSPEKLRTIVGSAYGVLPDEYNRIEQGKESGCFHHDINITPLMKVALSQLLNNDFGEDTRKLYCESKAIELISCVLEEFSCGSSSDHYFSPVEIKRISYAREILVENLADPPGLMELSVRVGMNHTRLNKGFRKVYGKTMFAYLCDIRLEKAREYLEKGEMNCTETSFSVGYSSPSHFAKVFKEKYNVSPSCIIKKIVPAYINS